SQNQRERVLASFRAGGLRTLVATDIAARGIDVEGVSHVVNYDLPNIPESYVHRIGRTARAGADGVAISFCDAEERAYLRDIEKLIRITIPATHQRGERPSPAATPAHQQRQQPRRQQPQQRPHGQQVQSQQHAQRQQPRPQQPEGRPQQSQKPRNGHAPARPAQHAQPKPAASHRAPNADNIGAVAFMQPTRRRPAGPSRHAPR
ncbi:MAG: RNA helicase, partial [Hyphomicrobiales bacterium]|nr:RNA helicase [Hyphomicrobiales bacterium]